ncbi:Bax inhibitor-1/YccA family protein [bacterium]|nr:Bax inhibitor-1/YccA family protein [bacterium]
MTSNPLLSKGFTQETILEGRPMTIQNTANKTIILLGIVAIVAYFSWGICASGYSDKAYLLLIGSAIAGFVLALITAFNPKASPITAPAYAVCEGLLVGAVSYAYGKAFNGIVFDAIAISILTLFVMLFLYKARIIQATEKFRKVILISTFAIAIFYLAGFIGSLLGHPMTIFDGGIVGIIVSLVICAIAALNFVIDFDIIEQGEKNMYPSYFEWYGAFGILVTLIWLYFEVLRLLAQLNSRD